MWRKISQSDAKNNNNVIIRCKSRRKSFAIFKVDLAFFILAVHQLFHIWNCILILPTQETTFISLSEFIGNFPPLSRNTARSRRCYRIVVHTRLKMNGSTSISYIYNIYVYENANALTAGTIHWSTFGVFGTSTPRVVFKSRHFKSPNRKTLSSQNNLRNRVYLAMVQVLVFLKQRTNAKYPNKQYNGLFIKG